MNFLSRVSSSLSRPFQVLHQSCLNGFLSPSGPQSSLSRQLTGPDNSIFGYIPHFRKELKLTGPRRYILQSYYGPDAFKDKPIQEWWDYDGFGAYKYRHHHYANNGVLNDVQKRRIFKRYAGLRNRLNCIRKSDILPNDMKKIADKELLTQTPKPSGILNIKRLCTMSGRRRGIFHQFRMSRMIFRLQADYNYVSGVQRAKWMYGIHIKP